MRPVRRPRKIWTRCSTEGGRRRAYRESSVPCPPPHQGVEMERGRLRQSFEIVAAFENRHDPLAAMAVGEIHQLLRRPGKVGLGQVEARERIAPMRVEPG